MNGAALLPSRLLQRARVRGSGPLLLPGPEPFSYGGLIPLTGAVGAEVGGMTASAYVVPDGAVVA